MPDADFLHILVNELFVQWKMWMLFIGVVGALLVIIRYYEILWVG